ncbi:solute carrier organic anion transporter family member 4A1, partial [Biomphalaria glabrata]
IAVIPAGGGATFAGGFIVHLYNLKVREILQLCTVMSFLLFLLTFALVIECDTGPFAGVTLSYGQTDVT